MYECIKYNMIDNRKLVAVNQVEKRIEGQSVLVRISVLTCELKLYLAGN